MDRRRLRGERTRHVLIETALELFATNGYDETTIDEIASEAGVSPRTFFHHFPSKEDVLFDGYAERLSEATRRFRAQAGRGSLWQALAEVSHAVVDALEEQPEVFRQRAELYGQVPALRATMLRLNEDWIDEMTLEVAARLGLDHHADVRPRLAASLVNSANRAAIDLWVGSGGAIELRQAAAESVALIRPAITRLERLASDDAGSTRRVS